MGVEELWQTLWLSGQVSESEFRRIRDDEDRVAARAAIAEALPGGGLEQAAARWGGAEVSCVPRDSLPARVRRSMAGSYLTLVGAAATPTLPSVAIVGTRGVPTSTAARLELLIEQIVRSSVSVVSGGAYGVDTLCQNAALAHGVPASIVIAGGLLHPSPAGNRAAFEEIVRAGGAVLTDRAPRRRPHRRDFVRRNALIAALADVVVVAAAPKVSGALETARVAKRLGVPVLAVPGMFDDPVFAGCHQLLRDGAGVCSEPADVMRAMGAQPVLPLRVPQPTPSVSTAAGRMLTLLRAGLTVDGTIRAGEFSAADAQAAHLELELAGLLPP